MVLLADCEDWFCSQIVTTGSVRRLSRLVLFADCQDWFCTQIVKTGSVRRLPRLVLYADCQDLILLAGGSVSVTSIYPRVKARDDQKLADLHDLDDRCVAL